MNKADLKYYLHQLKDWYNRRILANRQQLLTFAIFLSISAAFWFLDMLNNKFTATIEYPVHFVNLPEDKAETCEVPQTLALKVQAHGFHLLGYQLTTVVAPLEVDLREFELVNQSQDGSIQILTTKQLFNSIVNQLPSDIELLDIEPSSVLFDFTPQSTRMIPVKPLIVYDISNQYLIKTIIANPDSVRCIGPAEMLDTLRFISSTPVNIGKVEKNLEMQVQLVYPNSIRGETKSVDASVIIEEYTEASIQVPVEVTQVPDSLKVTIYPREVTVNYRVAISDFSRIKPYQFRVVAPYSVYDHTIHPTNKMRLVLKKYPNSVYSPSIHPQQIDYILEKND